jgi:hypothetical protein
MYQSANHTQTTENTLILGTPITFRLGFAVIKNGVPVYATRNGVIVGYTHIGYRVRIVSEIHRYLNAKIVDVRFSEVGETETTTGAKA